jgi:hypothetical protein
MSASNPRHIMGKAYLLSPPYYTCCSVACADAEPSCALGVCVDSCLRVVVCSSWDVLVVYRAHAYAGLCDEHG